jgi:DNA-binding LacI/PurR family transcriptional regulator
VRITITDIAKQAGVSKTTVSFAFNDPSKISKETYERVMRIADEYGYIPDPVARTLTTRRIGTFGLLLPQSIPEAFKNPYLSELLRGIGDACEEAELSLTILPPIKGRIADAARRAAVDALLAVGVGPDTRIVELLHKRHIPFVTLDGKPSELTVNVGVDDERASYALMGYVLSLGHRRVTVVELKNEIFNQPDERFSYVRDRRMAGFERALAEAGLSLGHPDINVITTECSIEGGERAAAMLKESAGAHGIPTAVVAMADIVAVGICMAFRSLGVNVPGDVSVVGFDDAPCARMNVPALTTVHQPGYEKGYQAAKLVYELLNGNTVGDLTMESALVIRSSAAVPRL